jgi:CheY-like chemotaxis protein
MARIVIAEDSLHIRNVLAMWMSRNGHEVQTAPNGRLALEVLQSHPADLLIADVNMPEMDGIELTARAFEACPTLQRAFVVTSRCDQHEILAQLSDPRVSVFPKPFSPSQLLREVEQATNAAPEDEAGLSARPDGTGGGA